MLKVGLCEHLIGRVECPGFYSTTELVIHPWSALELGQAQASKVIVPLGMPIGTNTWFWKVMGTASLFYYQNVWPGNTSASCPEMKHLLLDFTVCSQHWGQGVVFPQQSQKPWAPLATWGDKTALHSPHSGGDSWGVPVYGTEQEWGLFYIIPMKKHVSMDEHICNKLCLDVVLLPSTYTAKGSGIGHDKSVLLQAGWQHFTLE